MLLLGGGSASAAVLPVEVSEYRKDFDLSQAQAEEALQTQARAVDADLVGQLQDRLGARYAGLWFDNDSGEYVVPLLPGANGRAVAAEFAGAALGGDRFRTVPAQSSWAELEAAQKELDGALASSVDPEQVQTSLDPRTNAVVVRQAADAAVGERGEIGRLAANASVEVEVRASRADGFGGAPEACNDPFCGSPLRGGVHIYDPSDPSRPCTAGFPAVGDDGARYLLTAGHCVKHYGIPDFLNWASKDDALQVRTIGSVAAAEYPGGDWAKINANGSWWDTTSSPWRSRIVYWGTPILDKGGVVGKTPTVNESYPIRGEAASVVGNYACHSGIVTGTTCGPIVGVNVTYTTATLTVYGLNRMANACASPGDSGGPVFFGGKALGMHHNSESPAICEDTLLYIDILKATQALGAHIPLESLVSVSEDDNTSGPRVSVQSTGTEDVFYRTASNALGHDWYVPALGWAQETRPGPLASTSVPRTVTQRDGTVDVFYRTPSNELGHDWYAPGKGWSHEVRPGSLASDPRVAVQPNGTLDVFYRDTSGGLGHDWYVPAVGWSHETRPGPIASDPHVLAQENGTVDVFYRTPSNELGHDWYAPGNGWSHEVQAGPLAAEPRPVVQESGTVDVFYRTPSNTLGHDWYVPGKGWSHEIRPGSLASDPHVVTQPNGTIDVFYRTPSAQLGHQWYAVGVGWSTETRPASMASDPHVLAQENGTVDVFYRTPSNELGHQWYAPGNGWSTETRPGPIASDPHLAAQSNGTIDVVYFTPSGELGHDWYIPGKGWSHEVRTAVTEQSTPVVSAVTADGGMFVKTGSLTETWTEESIPGVKILKASVAAAPGATPVLAAYAENQHVYVKQGLNGAWVDQGSAMKSVSVAVDSANVPLIGVVTTGGLAMAKQGLNGSWVSQMSSAATISVATDSKNGPLIGVLKTTGVSFAKQGSLSAPWVEEESSNQALVVASDSVNGPLIGVLRNSGVAAVKQGHLSAPWVNQESSVKALSLATDSKNGPLIGVLKTTGVIAAKQGSLSAPWVEEISNATALSLGTEPTKGPLIGALLSSGHGYVKQGNLSAPWVDELGGAVSLAVAG